MMPRSPAGSAFPDRRDPDYMAYLAIQIELGARCDGCCGALAAVRAHGVPRSRGGADRGNVALLCRTCDVASEKRWAAWSADVPGRPDLFERARARDQAYEAELAAGPLPF